jgi:hypothetical protein
MEAFAKPKCFRRGHDFTGEWDSIINLIILINATPFPNRQAQPESLSHLASKTSNSTAKIPAKARVSRSELNERSCQNQYKINLSTPTSQIQAAGYILIARRLFQLDPE